MLQARSISIITASRTRAARRRASWKIVLAENFADAEAETRAYWRSATPAERLNALEKLREPFYGKDQIGGRLFSAPGLPTKPTFLVDRELRSCTPSRPRLCGRESSCLQNEAPISPDHLAKTILDGSIPTQLHIDFRTQRPTAIDFISSTADQRAACTALKRERTRGILEAAQLAPSRESFPVDVWNAIFARKSKQKGVPLIPLERLGIHHDEDGMLSSDFLVALPSGAEANPYRDDDWNVVYKFFFLGEGGSLGRKIALEEPESDRFEIQLLPARLVDTLEKLSVLNEAGGHPTEIVGLSSNADFLIAKQPLAFPYKDYQKDREVATKAVGGIVPLFTNLERQVAVIWLNLNGWLISDLHHRNIMRDREGNPTIIDALIGPVPLAAQRKLAWLRNALDDAEDVRCGREPRKRMQFGDEADDDSL